MTTTKTKKAAPYLEMVNEYLSSQPNVGKNRRRRKKKKMKRKGEGEGSAAATAAANDKANRHNRPSTAATVDSADESPSAYVYDYYVISNEYSAGGNGPGSSSGLAAAAVPRVALDEGLVWWPGLDGDGNDDGLFGAEGGENGDSDGGGGGDPGYASSDSNAEGYYANSYPDEEEGDDDDDGDDEGGGGGGGGRRGFGFEKSSSDEGDTDLDGDGDENGGRHRRRLDDFLDDEYGDGEERGGYSSEEGEGEY